jgi:hypothetical protein
MAQENYVVLSGAEMWLFKKFFNPVYPKIGTGSLDGKYYYRFKPMPSDDRTMEIRSKICIYAIDDIEVYRTKESEAIGTYDENILHWSYDSKYASFVEYILSSDSSCITILDLERRLIFREFCNWKDIRNLADYFRQKNSELCVEFVQKFHDFDYLDRNRFYDFILEQSDNHLFSLAKKACESEFMQLRSTTKNDGFQYDEIKFSRLEWVKLW